jgi:hypothetical protein
VLAARLEERAALIAAPGIGHHPMLRVTGVAPVQPRERRLRARAVFWR